MTVVNRSLIACIARLLMAAVAPRGHAAEGVRAGPLFDEFSLTLAPGCRTEVLGPLFYSETKDSQRTWAFPPLLSHAWDPGTESDEYDFGYPVLTYRRYGSEYRWQLAQVLSFSGGRDQEERKIRDFTLFPIYFQQRSGDPARNYTALFPIYGHLQNRLFRDEIFFVLFPFYGQSRKADVVTDNYLYPFFHLRRGNGLRGWQFWPFVGHEHKDPTTLTNGFGDTELVPGHDNHFVLWPVYFDQTMGIGTEDLDRQQGILPFYSYERSPQRDMTTVVWPFFTHITDREKKYSEWQTPWPLVIFTRGEGKTVSRVWPFFSRAQNTNLQSTFYAWPVYKYNRVQAGALDAARTRILFYLYSDSIQKNTETGQDRRRIDFWPFFTRQRDFNGNTRLQIFAPLEPILPDNRCIERDYSPVWSVWRSEDNPRTGAASRSLLWNLYRWDVTPGSKKCSLLFGLFQYESGSEGKRLRLFHIPVVKTKPPLNTDLR